MPPSIFSNIGGLISADIKDGEADALKFGASKIGAAATALESLVDADAPQGVAALVAAIEKADSILGPGNAAAVNAIINTYETQIDAELTKILSSADSTVNGFIPAAEKAMNNVAVQLETEANEQRHPGETAAQAAPPAGE